MKRLAFVALLAVAPAVLSAQSSTRHAALKHALRNLVVAQENYFANHGTYTTDVSALGLFRGGKPADSVWVQVVNAGGRSWNGRAIHMAANGKSCVIYVGFKTDLPSAPVTDADSLPAKNEGEPVCDRM
ncbi:MAG TPA: hypothetical protein VN803_06940 [Gemmatimonadales bacterium]|nr:hypothetical protein [Gemmatimonadales bacterium]